MRGFAILLGLVLIILGILGSFHSMTPKGILFEVFKVNWVTDFLYILTGILGVIFGLLTYSGTRLYFEVIGIVYAIWAILGFVYQQHPIFGVIGNNLGTTWLNVVIAVIALIIGFGATGQKKI